MAERGILLVDDDPDIRGAMRLALEMEGHDVELARDGDDAWRRLRARPAPALILLDVMMPGLDGSELLRLVRADPDLRDVPVVLITALSATSRFAPLAAETQGWLRKPIELDDLLGVVSRYCALRR